MRVKANQNKPKQEQETLNYRSMMRLQPGDELRAMLKTKGVLLLDGQIEEGGAYTFNIGLLCLEATGCLNNKPLWIVLNSPGGEVNYGFAIYDTIKSLVDRGRTINIIGQGLVASMAVTIMQAGTRRYSLPHTQFLVHQVSKVIGIFGGTEASQAQEEVEELNRLNNITLAVIANRAGIGLEELKKLCRKTDYWLDAEKAKKLGTAGLIDEIVTVYPFFNF